MEGNSERSESRIGGREGGATKMKYENIRMKPIMLILT